MDWTSHAVEIHRELEERREFILATASATDEELVWLSKHLDLAFEGRRDYLRSEIWHTWLSEVCNESLL